MLFVRSARLWVQPSPLEQLSIILNRHPKKIVHRRLIKFCDLDCAPKGVRTWKPSTYLVQRLATAGLQLTASIMTCTWTIRPCKRLKKYLFALQVIGLGIIISSSNRDAQRAPPRATAWALRPSTCAAPRASAGCNDQVTSTHNERSRGRRPGFHSNCTWPYDAQ
jgi:hypothetical protein